ncbi:hypothetical protein G3N58_05560 [Paraburkholderia sp. Ac-20342]|uniref:AraC family transcriptional regulator n=1 Tax=Paraburkholderia sp. Ac-20342 TaxID=2703889 RepID=UPI001980385B|nr:DJ-1/PfpI family protein [Paraburkholderia sp. Ac-20342]MBN3846298.1 hypothetical protein [Paraburkholderia sp. Ac-20342]
MPQRSLKRFTFLLLPGFTMIAFVNCVEVLRLANQLHGEDLFEWSICSAYGGYIESSNGLSIETTTIQDARHPEILFVCAGNGVHKLNLSFYLSLLREFSAFGTILGGLCTGSFVLAKAGLLDGYACTIHWEYLVAQQERFHHAKFERNIFVIDRDRVTCVGGAASLDMMLCLIRTTITKDLREKIVDYLMLDSIRDGKSIKTIPKFSGHGCSREVFQRAVELMEGNLDQPISSSLNNPRSLMVQGFAL